MLTSVVLAMVLPAYTFLAGAVGIPYTLVTRDARPLYWLGRLGVRIGFWLARIRIVTHGSEKLSGEPHFIYMMNHNSNLDAPAVWLHVPGQVRALGKKELFRLPVLATAMKLGGFVPVDRSNRDRAVASIREATQLAADGDSFLIAPEGTRSRTGRLLAFKKGGFHLAMDSGVPILPITVLGAHELMPPGSYTIRPGTIEIHFHDPIPTSGLSANERPALMERVRAPMLALLDRHFEATSSLNIPRRVSI
jgi:1-acyl-sn-glycerol-3-phosphate acyltransferase